MKTILIGRGTCPGAGVHRGCTPTGHPVRQPLGRRELGLSGNVVAAGCSVVLRNRDTLESATPVRPATITASATGERRMTTSLLPTLRNSQPSGAAAAATRYRWISFRCSSRAITSHGHVDDLYPVMEEIRARGPLVRTPFVWASVDHGLCREILRDKRFGVIPPADMELPQPLRMLLTRTDPGVANPVEPPAMVIVNPPDHTRYRQLVSPKLHPTRDRTPSTRAQHSQAGVA